ncbi:MAG: Na/Pi cotransporter family protein [Firmicutes bacterium]|nr:Na/Pi cotransporter family protein [Bacillota bacterium]
MQTSDILMLLGGLALFLYGMQMMSGGLEAAAGNKMKDILEKLTSGKIRGVLVGAGITAVIQSSSATTVMVVGFVSAGLMSLNQAVGVIMGANIGTTITGQLIALDVSALAPLITFAGVVLTVFFKSEKAQHIGSIIAGLGVLFIGMDMMSSAMEPLRDSPTFVSLVSNFDNPVIGILVGAGFTAIIQSSSASVGILQALAMSGVIGLPQAVYVLFGQNIGTCITAVLASIGTKTEAKRTTIIHLMFNIIGTIIFTIICMATPFAVFMESLTPGNVAAQIANVHTVFNITTTLILLPFAGVLANIATKILPDKEEEIESGYEVLHLYPIDGRAFHQVGLLSVILKGIENEVARMYKLVEENIVDAFDCIIKGKADTYEDIEKREDYIDYLNEEVSKYIAKIAALEMEEEDAAMIGSYYKILGDIERVGDHAMNFAEYARNIEELDEDLTAQAIEDIEKMRAMILESLRGLKIGQERDCIEILKETAQLEQRIDDFTEVMRKNQLERMRAGQYPLQVGLLFSGMITDFERIGDHALNIAEEYNVIA